jgi:hypothetical protein
MKNSNKNKKWENYYEIRIPLTLTPLTAGLNPDTDAYNDSLWFPSNSLQHDCGLFQVFIY